MKAPNGHVVMIGDIWRVKHGSPDLMLILCFNVWHENQHAFCKTFRLGAQKKVFLGFDGNPEKYELVSRIDDNT